MKYIHLDLAGFIVFDRGVKHCDMADKFPHDTVLSAGFVESWTEDLEIICRGESQSLNKESNKDDSRMLTSRISGYYSLTNAQTPVIISSNNRENNEREQQQRSRRQLSSFLAQQHDSTMISVFYDEES